MKPEPVQPAMESRDRLLTALWFAGLIAAAGMALAATPLADRDFASLWMAGRLALDGQAASAYSSDLGRIAAAEIGTVKSITFPYPPHSFPLFIPFAFTPYYLAFALWDLVSVAAFWLAARPLLPRKAIAITMLASPATLICLQYGQTGLFFGAAWLLAFRYPVVTVALTVKPHLGMLAGIEVLRSRQFFQVAGIAILLLAGSVAIFGWGTWQAYIEASARQTNWLTVAGPPEWNGKIVTPLYSYGVAGWLVWAACAAWLLSKRFNVFTAATASFLISPYGLHYDMVVVCVGFGLLLYHHWSQLRASEKVVAASAMLSPVLVAAGSWIVPPILLAGLWLQTMRPGLSQYLSHAAAIPRKTSDDPKSTEPA